MPFRIDVKTAEVRIYFTATRIRTSAARSGSGRGRSLPERTGASGLALFLKLYPDAAAIPPPET